LIRSTENPNADVNSIEGYGIAHKTRAVDALPVHLGCARVYLIEKILLVSFLEKGGTCGGYVKAKPQLDGLRMCSYINGI